MNVVYESVGGDVFDACLSNLAVKGRLIVIGMISGYQDGSAWTGRGGADAATLSKKLLAKSASVRGFFLMNFKELFAPHMMTLWGLVQEGKLRSVVDKRVFKGVDSIADAIDYMYSRKNIGKVVVQVSAEAPSARL